MSSCISPPWWGMWHVKVCMHVHMNEGKYVSMYVCMHACMHVCMKANMYFGRLVRSDLSVYVCLFVAMYVCR